jgi:Na+/H+ antiporter NhaD/arsenite permease-like protein
MSNLVVVVFVLTYFGMALGRVPGLKIDRTGIALLAAVVLLASGAIDRAALGRFIDMPTLLLLFALMIVSAQFAAAGFYDACARKITAAEGSPTMLLGITVAVSGGLSTVLANDIVVYAMTPMLCAGVRARGLDPRPFLAGLAGASNAGSAITVIGNPQNILIGQTGGLDFWTFLVACGVPGLVSLVIVFGAVRVCWRAELRGESRPTDLFARAEPDRWQMRKGMIATVALLALFATPLPREIGALVIAAGLLASRRLASRAMIGAVDWHLLLLFACLFAVTGAFAATGMATDWTAWLAANDLMPDRLAVMAPLALIGSNTIGNVPGVMLLLSLWPGAPHGALYGLALLSTLAGNLFLVGSLANLIVAERAQLSGVTWGFRDHARAGVPMTLLSMALAVLWLGLMGWMAW